MISQVRLIVQIVVVMTLSLATAGLAQETITADPFKPHPMDDVAIADCHVHMVDFLQNGGYLLDGNEIAPHVSSALPSGSRHFRIELLLWKMKQCNISHALICGMPFIKKWNEDDPFRSAYYLSSSSRVVRARDTDYTIGLAVEDFRAAHPERFEKEFPRICPFICGFDGTDVGAVGMIIKRIKEFPGVWKGIGEVMSRHDDLTNLTLGERPRANHSSLFRIYDFAGDHGMRAAYTTTLHPLLTMAMTTARDTSVKLSMRFARFQRRLSYGAMRA